MRRATALWLIMLSVVFGLASAQISTTEYQSDDEQVLWELEKAYFAHLADLEFEELEDFWHPAFIGCPSHSPEPVGLDSAQHSLEELTAKLKRMSISLRPQAITMHGDVSVVHYFIDVEQEDLDGQVTEYSQRVTHTWVKSDGKWRVLGGMSAR
ncbi:MAG: hypothetical protein AMS21_05240 [Gemmatimonas sp. SG8_38_2]|nr:MAG: hypothetical protein AMS21_05240 [Gemmatimonas sp. SG8_38_2]